MLPWQQSSPHAPPPPTAAVTTDAPSPPPSSSPSLSPSPPLLPPFAVFATSAQHPLSRPSSAESWTSARANDRRYQQNTSLVPDRQVGPAPATAAIVSRTRPLTSSERGRQFRLRERVHEQSLVKDIKEIRERIAQLENSRDLLKQRSLTLPTSVGGSLEKIARKLYSVYRYGLESVDPTTSAIVRQSHGDLLSLVNYKENFLRCIVEQDAMCGDVIGVDALLEQWRKHTLSYTKFEIEVVRVEPIVGSETHPIVVVHTKLHTHFTRKTLAMMFPGVMERRPELTSKFVNRDITFDCISRFMFSERGQITTYLISMNMVEALVKAVDSARDVAELMAFSVVTPSLAIQDPESLGHAGLETEFRGRQDVDRCSEYATAHTDTWKRASGWTGEQVVPVRSEQWREAYNDFRGHRDDQLRLPAIPTDLPFAEEDCDEAAYSYMLHV